MYVTTGDCCSCVNGFGGFKHKPYHAIVTKYIGTYLVAIH